MVDAINDNDNITQYPFQLVGDPDMRNLASEVRQNSIMLQRLALISRMGKQFDGARDLYEVFGYKKSIAAEDFWSKYIRQDIAARIVDAPPDAVWSNPPTVTMGGRNRDNTLNELIEDHDLWGTLCQADKFNRLGTFSLLLFGFSDGASLAAPVRNADGLNYVRAVPSSMVKEVQLETNPANPRFGKPIQYKINFADPKTRSIATGTNVTAGTRELVVHWHRVVHIVENPLEDEITGVPVLERVFNLLDDVLKVSGGTAETYWLTSNRGMQVDVDKEMTLGPDDAAALEEEIEEYQHQLRRYIKTRGVKINSLGSDTPNPKEVFEMLISLLSGATGIPKRILIGSEAGQLASEQDRANWAERIDERRTLFATPKVVRPVILTLQRAGLLSKGRPTIEWPDAFIQSPLERAQTMAQTARAIGNISRQTGNKAPMQLVTRLEGREILGLKDDISEADLYGGDPFKLSDEELKQTQGIMPRAPEDADDAEDEEDSDNPPVDREE